MCPLGILDLFLCHEPAWRSPHCYLCFIKQGSLTLPSPSHQPLVFRKDLGSNLHSVTEPSRDSGPLSLLWPHTCLSPGPLSPLLLPYLSLQ